MIGPYLIDAITLTRYNGSDKWQEPVAATDEAVKAFVDYSERRIQNESGQMVLSTAKIYMRDRTIITSGFSTRAANTISYLDTITFDGEIHGIMKIGKARDFSVRVLEVYVA